MTNRTLNCGVFSPNEAKSLFTHACLCEYVSKLDVNSIAGSSSIFQAYFKCISLLSVQTLEKSTQNEKM